MEHPSNCLRELQYKSLLSYDPHTQQYRYHQLIKEFFTYISNEYEDSELLNKTFISHFTAYFASYHGSCGYVDEIRNLLKSIDAERPNFDFLNSHSLQTCPSYAEFVIESLAGLVFNLTDGILHTLRLCKSLHLRSRLLNLLQNMDSWLDITTRNTKALQNIQNLDKRDQRQHLAHTLLKLKKDIHFSLIHEFTEHSKLMDSRLKALSQSRKDLQNILQEENLLRNFVQIMLRLNENQTLLYSYIQTGDVYGAIFVGISIGREGLLNFDGNFRVISMHTGLSAYLEMYVNLHACSTQQTRSHNRWQTEGFGNINVEV